MNQICAVKFTWKGAGPAAWEEVRTAYFCSLELESKDCFGLMALKVALLRRTLLVEETPQGQRGGLEHSVLTFSVKDLLTEAGFNLSETHTLLKRTRWEKGQIHAV